MKLEKITEKSYTGRISKEYYINLETNLMEGEYKEYWGDGKLYIESNYKNGELDGIHKTWHYKFNFYFKKYYSNGKEMTRDEYYNNDKNNQINVSYLGLMI